MEPSSLPTLDIDGVRVPRFLYGTAWKEERTRPLTALALARGFRGIDTANQRKHYHEAAVGEAIGAAVEQGLVTRDDLFLQTKFTFRSGQDHRLPYDEEAPFATQVEQSFASSLEHLGLDRETGVLDAYVLHGPSQRPGLGAADREVWAAMEGLHDAGHVRLLGVSNVDARQLDELCDLARVPPRLAQIRTYARHRWEAEVRAVCAERGVVYQGFSLLTANRTEMAGPVVASVAQRLEATPAQVVLRFALQLGMIVLTGTSDPAHMEADLAVLDDRFALDDAEIEALMTVGV